MAEVLARAMFIDTTWLVKVLAREQAATEQCVFKQHSAAPMTFQGLYQEASYKSVSIAP